MEFEGSVHQFSYIVSETDLDAFGHVNNANYLQIYEKARWDLISANGYGLETIKQSGIGPVILEINGLKFKKELLARDEIIIHTKVTRIEGRFMDIYQWMERQSKVVSEVTLTTAMFDLNKRRLLEPQPDWLKAVGVTIKNGENR